MRFFVLLGLLSWNVLDCHVDLEEELNNLTNHGPEGEAARHGNYSSIFPLNCCKHSSLQCTRTNFIYSTPYKRHSLLFDE